VVDHVRSWLDDAVTIASMHRAKGTEFSPVVVVGAEAGVERTWRGGGSFG
jgi:superfamily I DNA/RNA helicase